MKVKGFIVLLMMIACTQKMFAQKVTLYLCNNQKLEYDILLVDSITFKDTQETPLITDLWDYMQFNPYLTKLKAYIENKKPGILFYNKDYVPLKGGEDWDMYLKCFNAQINEGDSAYIMVMPTNEAWDKAIRKLAPLYRYPNRYEDKMNDIYVHVRNIEDPDSLANMSMSMDITSPLVFNRHEQPEDGSYLLNTRGDTLRSTATWNMNSIFNGYRGGVWDNKCYEATEWAMPKEWYFPDIEVEIDDEVYYGKESAIYYKAGDESKKIDFDSNRFSDIVDKYGRVSRNDFYWLSAPSAVSNPQVEIKLTNNVMSGKYDIYAVMVPYWYCKLTEEGFADRIRDDQSFADSVSAICKMCFTARVRYNNNEKNGHDVLSAKTQNFEYDGTKVDTILIAEDFEFPFSYKNLRYTYPTLILQGAVNSKMIKDGFQYSLCIDRILLKSKEEE